MEYKDYYKIMEVGRNATQDKIKRAYRKLARKYHPDVSKESDAEEKFKELGEAYEVLKDPQKRAAYDHIGSQWKQGQGFKPPPDWDAGFEFSGGGFTGANTSGFSDFFESLFGRMYPRPGERVYSRQFHAKGDDHHAKVLIDLEDVFHGASRSVSLTIPELDKSGRVITKTRTLNVKIPTGVKEGQRIRLAGQGGSGFGQGMKGDLYLEIKFKPHRVFHAVGRDIFVDLPLAPWEAALGATIQVPTLAGKVQLKVPANSQAGNKLRLKGRGLPDSPNGDQYVTLRIVTPPADSDEAKALYQKMAKAMPMNPRAAMGI